MNRSGFAAGLTALLPGLMTAAACAGGTMGVDGRLVGEWGGTGVAVELGEAGGTVEFDCAHGAFGPVTAEEGSFEVSGTWAPEGGPSTGDERAVPATYAGTAFDGRIVFTVRVQDQVEPFGPFIAQRGKTPLLRKCL